MKVNYLVASMQLNPKSLKVGIIFKRVPTQEQLEEFNKEKKEDSKMKLPAPLRNIPGIQVLAMMHEGDGEDMTLNFDQVRMILSVEETNELGLKMGMVVQLDIPETKEDVVIKNE